jgi:signal transduction histidine kinase
MSTGIPHILEYIEPGSLDIGRDQFATHELAALDAVNQQVASGASLSGMMDFLFVATRNLFPCDRIGLAFLEDDGQRVAARWARATYSPLVLGEGYAEDLRGSSLEAIITQGRIRIIHDLAQYLERKPISRSSRLLVEEGVRASMTCPLSVEGRRVGFLFRSSRQSGVYSTHEVKLHLALAERLSQAVEKGWRIDRLTAANQAYLELLGFVSHELKSPLSSIIMDGGVLMGDYLGELQAPQRAKVASMVSKAKHLLGLVRDYLDLARLEEDGMQPRFQETPLLSGLLEPVLEIVQPVIDSRNMNLQVQTPSPPLPVECDPDLIKIVLVNLLSNAAKYGAEGGQIRLEFKQSPSKFSAAVRNDGAGFPPEQRERLFRKFSRLEVPALRDRPGTGVGLYTAWRIVQMHHGRIEADSEPGEWAEFRFEIPQQQAGPAPVSM